MNKAYFTTSEPVELTTWETLHLLTAVSYLRANETEDWPPEHHEHTQVLITKLLDLLQQLPQFTVNDL